MRSSHGRTATATGCSSSRQTALSPPSTAMMHLDEIDKAGNKDLPPPALRPGRARGHRSIMAAISLELFGQSLLRIEARRRQPGRAAHGAGAPRFCAKAAPPGQCGTTRIALALFAQIPWRGSPVASVEIMLLPRWFPIEQVLDKVATLRTAGSVVHFVHAQAGGQNPRNVHIRELFTTPPEAERHYFRRKGLLTQAFLAADRLGRLIDPRFWRIREMRCSSGSTAKTVSGPSFSGHGQCLEAMVISYAADDPRRVTAKRALQKLPVVGPSSAYCQPRVDGFGTAVLAMQEVSDHVV